MKGDKCSLPKCPVVKRNFKPGAHGATFKKVSDYGLQLREKQKAKRIYGVLERQFRTYVKRASREKGNRGEILLQLLERRIDNVIYRLGMTVGRKEARLLVVHGHFLVNGKKVDIPSYLVLEKDKIEIRKKSRGLELFKKSLKNNDKQIVPQWLKFDKKIPAGTVVALPKREEIETTINEQLIIEFYSR
jgi:small subunit ribosomal protein S4